MFNFKMKKILAAGVAVLALSALSVTAFAASAYNSPAEAVAALTGKTVESVVDQRQETGDTYCTIAEEAGVLDEYKAAVLEIKQDALDARIAEGRLTQDRADEIMAAVQTNMAECDGNCDNSGAGLGQKFGAAFGLGNGDGTGNGLGNGNGNCAGSGIADGTCTGSGSGTGNTDSGFGGGHRGGNGIHTQDGSCLTATDNG